MIKSQPKKEPKNFKEKVKHTAKNKIRHILKNNGSKERLEYWQKVLNT